MNDHKIQCDSNHPGKEARKGPYTPDQCKLCWLLLNNGKVSSKCRHRGDMTGQQVLCPTCAGTVRLHVYRCNLFGSCTLGKKVENVACCKGCEAYAEEV